MSVREQYDEDGFVIFRGVVGADLVAEAADHVEWLQRRHPDRRAENLDHELVPDDPFWLRLVSDDRLLDVAQRFIGPDIALFASHYICKPPYSGQPVLWHQDGGYWPLEPMEVVTLWLAIDHSTPENGCVRVVPGSHRQELHQLRAVTDVDNVLGSEAAIDVDESHAVDLVLAPGDVEVHHPNILHASSANTSPHRRAGLTIRYIPTTTRVTTKDPWPCHFLLRGEPGVGPYAEWPQFDKERHFAFAGAPV
jgi:ectoine hydroxylase-related dioxygenase (phytanoyl-CoA dioxygenase family)